MKPITVNSDDSLFIWGSVKKIYKELKFDYIRELTVVSNSDNLGASVYFG